MKQNAQLALLDPPMQVTSNSMIWNMNTEIVTTDQPVRLVNRQRQITVTANQGRMDTQKEVAYLNGDVNGIGQRGQSLKSKELTWYLPSQLMEANGDVFYRQVDPPVSFKGKKPSETSRSKILLSAAAEFSQKLFLNLSSREWYFLESKGGFTRHICVHTFRKTRPYNSKT